MGSYTLPYNYTPIKTNSPVVNTRVHHSEMSALSENLKFRLARLFPARSLNAAAKEAGVSQPVLHRACFDLNYTPKKPNLERLAKYFGCSIEELFMPIALVIEHEKQGDNEKKFLIDYRKLPQAERLEVHADVKRRLAYLEATAYMANQVIKIKDKANGLS